MNNSGTVALRVSALTAAAFVLLITSAAQESTRAASQPEDSSLRELDSQVRELRAVIEQMRVENAQSRAEMRELRQELQDTRKLLAPLVVSANANPSSSAAAISLPGSRAPDRAARTTGRG